ncbi:uncharacterized protein [Dysidea avara]|uniref:uncharacterized protein isoform X2 n=1 Tax=Dysidea avara TaxID=196820 RepID=UPI00332A5AF4
MALIRSILRSLLKRLQTTLAVAQRIARFLLTTFRRTARSRREMWSIAETLLRSLTPEVPYGRTGEDGDEESTSNTIRNEEMTSTGVENDEVPQGASEMISDEEEVENGLDSPMISGKSLVSGVEHLAEVLEENGSAARENEGSITLDALDLAVPKERVTERIPQETEFWSSSLESSMTSNGEVDSESGLACMMENSSEEYLDDDQWKMAFDNLTITAVVQLSGEEDVYRGNFNGETVMVLTRSHQYPTHCLMKEAATIGRLDHQNIQKLVGYCNDTLKAIVMKDPGSNRLPDIVYKMEVTTEKKVDMLHQVACGLQYLQGQGLALSWLSLKVVWLDNDLKRTYAV